MNTFFCINILVVFTGFFGNFSESTDYSISSLTLSGCFIVLNVSIYPSSYLLIFSKYYSTSSIVSVFVEPYYGTLSLTVGSSIWSLSVILEASSSSYILSLFTEASSGTFSVTASSYVWLLAFNIEPSSLMDTFS